MKRYLCKLIIIFVTVSAVFGNDAKISSLAFYGLSMNPDKEISSKFEFHRVYLIYKKQASENLKYKLQMDMDYKSSPRYFYLKTAKVDWKSSIGTVVIGVQGMNMFKNQENTWGYRSLEKSAMDRYEFSASADLGIGLYRKLGDKITYSILVTNGPGYKELENDKYKKFSANVIFGESKLNKKDGINLGASLSRESYDIGNDMTETITVFGGFGGFSKESLRFGAEFDLKLDSDKTETEQIISTYGNLKFSNKTHLYVRLDLADDGSDKTQYFISGIAYTPEKGLTIMPNLRYEKKGIGDSVISYLLNFEFRF